MILVASLVWPIGTAAAQNPVTLESVSVDLWPELDQPGVTIFIEIKLAENDSTSQSVRIHIPPSADVVSLKNDAGNPLVWELTSEGQGQTLAFNTIGTITELTLYDPGVVKQDQYRSYSYEWRSANPVNALSFTLQVPYGAGQLVSEPQMTLADTCSQNCKYYALAVGEVEANEAVSLSFQYEKDLSNPAYSALSVRVAENIDDFTKGRTASPFSVVVWLAAVALAVTILVALYYWWFRRRSIEHHTRPVQGVGIDNPEKQAIFCHECGSRSRAGDTFCRNCGTELRRFN